jgi:hypothetical protein
VKEKMMAAPARTKQSNDFTGRQAAELAAKAAEEQKAKAAEMAMMTATQEKEFEDTIQDMTNRPESPTIIDEVLEVGVALADNTTVVRVAEDIENMTYGHGNSYTFKAGGKYKVPMAVADRLQELGLLYERL